MIKNIKNTAQKSILTKRQEKAFSRLFSQSFLKDKTRGKYYDWGLGRNFGGVLLKNCGSTQQEALSLLEEGAVPLLPFAVVSKGQTQGKGRGERTFLSPYNKGIYFTAVFDAEKFSDASLLGALCVLSIIKTVEEFTPLTPQIKWPNDLLIEGEKLCGILPQNKTVAANGGKIKNYLLLGAGINVNTSKKELSPLKNKAASLYIKGGKKINIKAFTAALINNFFEFAQGFESNLKGNIERYISLCCSTGKRVRYELGEEIKEGIITKINNDLSITVLKPDNTTSKIFWGEVIDNA